ncbi:DUF1883 domain-containing protein [Thalassotalea montiporae]
MKFTHYDLGILIKNQVVEVSLSGNAANVYLMESKHFQEYKRARKRFGIGGLMMHTPVRLIVPHSGHWLVTLDFGGFIGKVDSNVKVYPANTSIES